MKKAGKMKLKIKIGTINARKPLEIDVKFLYRGIVAKVQSPEALFSLGVVPVVSFATPKSKKRIKASAGWNVGTLEKPKMPLKMEESRILNVVQKLINNS